MASSSLSCTFKPHCTATTHRVLCLKPMPNSVFVLKHSQQLYCQTQCLGLQWIKKTRKFAVRATSIPPDAEAPSPSPPPSLSSDPFTNQIIIAAMQMFMSYLKETFGPIWIFKDRVDDAVQKVEDMANAVEDVAERVEQAAEDILDDLPEGRIKDFVNFVEEFAEDTADRADEVGDFIDKVQEEGDKVEDFMKLADERVDGYLANGNGQNNLFEALFANLLPSCETFSYF